MGKIISDQYYLLPDIEVQWYQWYGYFSQADNTTKCKEHVRDCKSKKRYKSYIHKINKNKKLTKNKLSQNETRHKTNN